MLTACVKSCPFWERVHSSATGFCLQFQFTAGDFTDNSSLWFTAKSVSVGLVKPAPQFKVEQSGL